MSGDYQYLVKTCIYMWEKLRDSGAKSKIEHIINKSLWSDNKEAVVKYKSAMKFKKNKNMDKAIELFKESIRIDPSFLAPKFELGMFAYREGEPSKALEYLNEIAVRVPFYADLHLILGEIQFKNKNYSTAIDHFNRALEYGFLKRQIKYIIKLKRGTSHYKLGEFEKAEDDIYEALKYNPGSLEALTLLAAINIKLKRYDSALDSLLKAHRLKKNNPVIIYKIGSLYYRKNDLRYIKYFDRLFNLTLRWGDRSKRAYYKAFKIIAIRHFEKKDFGKVIQIAEAIPQILNSSKHAKIIARAYFFTGKYKKTIEILGNMSLDDDDRFLLSKAYSRNKMEEKAKNILIQLIDNNEYYLKAKKDHRLKKIIRDIEADRRKEEAGYRENDKKGKTERDAGQ